MVVSTFHMLSRHEPHQDLGAHYFDVQQHHLVNWLTRRIERLGYRVRLEPVPAGKSDYFQGKALGSRYPLGQTYSISRSSSPVVQLCKAGSTNRLYHV
jgi:hypothetical protein